MVYFYAMPLLLIRDVLDDARLGVWQITEPHAYFLDRLSLTNNEQAALDRLPSPRQREWLASRYLLKVLIGVGEQLEIDNHPTGKPYLIGRAEEISLSHSVDRVAVVVGTGDVGVDIQICKDKIVALEHKFARPEESGCIDRHQTVRHLHLLWGAKETLYKIYAQKQLHFVTHLHVDLPEHVDGSGHFTGHIRIEGSQIPCTLEYLMLDEYVLVYGKRMD